MAQDIIKKAILDAYTEGRKSRRRVQIKTDQFLNFFLLEVFTGNVNSEKLKHSIRLFRDGKAETWGYNFTQAERVPFIAKMMREGYKQTRIAEMLRVHVSTIAKDVRYMRDATTLLADMPARQRKAKTKVSRVTRSIKPVYHQPALVH